MTYKIGNVSKGQSKALEKVEKPGGKANVEGVHGQKAVSKGTVKYTGGRTQKELDEFSRRSIKWRKN